MFETTGKFESELMILIWFKSFRFDFVWLVLDLKELSYGVCSVGLISFLIDKSLDKCVDLNLLNKQYAFSLFTCDFFVILNLKLTLKIETLKVGC